MRFKRLILLAAAAVIPALAALADGLPSFVSTGNTTKWYYVRNVGANRYLTANAPDVEGELKAGDSEPERRDKQLWKFTTDDDGQWYTITNKAEGLQLGVGLSAAHNNWESTQLMETSNTRFKIRFHSDSTMALRSESPAPGGGEIFVFPAMDGSAADNFMYWLVREANSEGVDSYMQLELYAVEEPVRELTLEEYLEAMPYGIDDYTYDPTAPGCVGDADAYEAFFSALTQALELTYDAASTDEAKSEALQNLKDAEARINAALNPITDGLYFIESAYSGFANADTMAWYAPLLTNFPGWEKKRNSVLFMWDVRKLADGNYSLRNLATGQYANHCVNPDVTNSPLRLSDSTETAQVIASIAPNGQFAINSAGAAWAYFPQEYNDGQGTHGPLASNEDKVPGGTAAWRLVPVSEEELAEAQAVQNRDILANMLTSFADNYAVGPDPGYLSQQAYDALQAEFAAARQLVDNSATDAECKEQLDKIQAAKEALEASEQPVTDGLYAILQYPYSQYPQSEGKAWKANADAEWLYSLQWKDYDPSFIWRISSIGNGRYSIQNYETGEYINSTDLVSPGAAINLSKTQATPQTITSRGEGAFFLSNTTLEAAGITNYNISGDEVVHAAIGGSPVYLHRYTAGEVEQMAAEYPQRLRTDTIRQLILETTPYTTIDSVYTADRTAPVVTDAAQLFITNQSVEILDLRYLIDESYSSYAISAYSTGAVAGTERDDYHAIRIDAGEGKTLPRNLALYWHFRPGGWANVFRPVHVRIYASNDLLTWDFIEELQNPGAGFPESEDAAEYVSPKAIVMPGKYRYLNMKVIDTNNHAIGLYGYPFFTFAEFNAYPMTAAKDETFADAELQKALDGLRAAIADATPKAEAGNASAQDIASFSAAYNEFLLNWKDTTDLYNTYAEASELSAGIVTGDDMFCYPDESAEAFDRALAEVDNARPFTEINQREVARLDTMLTRAIRDLQSSIIGPDPGKWYTVYSADASAKDGAGNTMVGQIAWMGGLTSVDGLGAGGESETAMLTDLRRAWKFEPTGTPLVYNMICTGSGWPLNLGPIRITPLGDGQFALLTGTNLNSTYYIYTPVLPGVPNSADCVAVKDGTGAWAMDEAPATLTSTISLNSGSLTAVVLPYDTRSLPTGTNGEAVKAYKVCGYNLADDGKTVTGINLAEITDGGIKAGTPFVVAAADGSTYDADTKVTVNLHAEVNGNVSREMSPQNGLYGTFTTIGLPQGMICFSRDSAYVEPAGFQVGIQRAYLDLSSVTTDPNATVARTVPVSGSATLTTGIGSVSAAKATVDVYTTDGILVRKGAKAAEAAKGLKRGVYIIGKKKTVVR